jgi:hypothetical protein
MIFKRNSDIAIWTVSGSAIKSFLVLDILISTGVYYIVKFYTSNLFLATAGSMMVGTPVKQAMKHFAALTAIRRV